MSDKTKKDEKVETVMLKDPDIEDSGNGDPRNPIDAVLKLTEFELLQFNHLNLKIDNLQQAIRVLQFEHDQAHRRFVSETHERNMQIERHQNMIGRLEKERETFAYELSDKYGVPAKYLAIDDETGAVKELPHNPEDAQAPVKESTN